MKRIKKLTASLLALAITAAGMSSIPAKAYSGYQVRKLEWTSWAKGHAALTWNTGSWYSVELVANSYVKNRTMENWADINNGSTLYAPCLASETQNLYQAVTPAGPTIEYRIKNFYSINKAKYLGTPLSGNFFV